MSAKNHSPGWLTCEACENTMLESFAVKFSRNSGPLWTLCNTCSRKQIAECLQYEIAYTIESLSEWRERRALADLGEHCVWSAGHLVCHKAGCATCGFRDAVMGWWQQRVWAERAKGAKA